MGTDFSVVKLKAELQKILGSVVDKRNSKNLKIVFKKCNFVLNESATVYPYHEAMIKEANKSFEHEDFYFTRADLVKQIGELANPSLVHEKIMKALKGYVPDSDLGAILSATQVCKMEDDGTTENKRKDARRRHIQAFKERGKTIYNWLRSGEVFEKDILPVLPLYERMDGGKQLFQTTVWESFLKLHPFRFFVPRGVLKEDLQDEILKRLLIYQQKEVKIYTRGRKVRFTQTAINELKKEELVGYSVSRSKPYHLGDTPAMTFTITKR